MSAGMIYVLTNPGMPGIVKVGRTSQPIEVRVAQLSGATGVPYPFEVVRARPTVDCHEAEERAHGFLEFWRVSERREFFEVPIFMAIMACDAAARVTDDPAINCIVARWFDHVFLDFKVNSHQADRRISELEKEYPDGGPPWFCRLDNRL